MGLSWVLKYISSSRTRIRPTINWTVRRVRLRDIEAYQTPGTHPGKVWMTWYVQRGALHHDSILRPWSHIPVLFLGIQEHTRTLLLCSNPRHGILTISWYCISIKLLEISSYTGTLHCGTVPLLLVFYRLEHVFLPLEEIIYVSSSTRIVCNQVVQSHFHTKVNVLLNGICFGARKLYHVCTVALLRIQCKLCAFCIGIRSMCPTCYVCNPWEVTRDCDNDQYATQMDRMLSLNNSEITLEKPSQEMKN